MRGSTAEPTGGVPSLTASEITDIYGEVFNRPPDATELASELENALKYSAAGIERQIRLRASNAPNTGVRGDENLAPLSVHVAVPTPIAGNVATVGPAALEPSGTPTGPTGTLAAPNVYGPGTYMQQPSYSPGGAGPTGIVRGYTPSAAPSAGGFDTTTLLIIGAMAVAAYFLLVK